MHYHLENDFIFTKSIFYWWNEKIIQYFNVYMHIGLVMIAIFLDLVWFGFMAYQPLYVIY